MSPEELGQAVRGNRLGTPEAAVPPAEGLKSLGLLRRRIGRSTLGRPLDAFLLGPSEAALRLLVIAGQHGDEPRGRAAARRWMIETATGVSERRPTETIARAAILDANPDGSTAGTRRNARRADLNRDHLVLAEPETRAIHAFVRRYRPHLIVDVHDYPARRRVLLARGWTVDPDVQLAGPTNPAVRTALGPADLEDLMDRLRRDLGSLGYAVAPYTLFRRSGKARPSTMNTLDARNVLSLRYGIPTFLVEGRDAGRQETDEEARRTVAAQSAALGSIDAWAQEHAALLLRGSPEPHPDEPIPLDARWGPAPTPPMLALRRTSSGEREVVPWTPYHGTVQVRAVLRLPRAYAVRADASAVTDLLGRQGFRSEWPRSRRLGLVERLLREESALPPAPSDPARPGTDGLMDLQGYVIYPVDPRGGRALALWLEARSRFGLVRRGILSPASLSGATPAVLRVRAWVDPRSRGLPKAQRAEESFPADAEGRPAPSGRPMVSALVSNGEGFHGFASAGAVDAWP